MGNHDLCLTGDALAKLQENKKLHDAVLPHVRVFARVAPKQKEQVINDVCFDLGQILQKLTLRMILRNK